MPNETQNISLKTYDFGIDDEQDMTDVTRELFGSVDSNMTKIDGAIGDIKQQATEDKSEVTTHVLGKTNPHGVTKTQIGLSNVDNTSDLAKPVSTATQTALNLKADKTQVLTDVPVGAKFTDTIYTHPTTAGNKHIPTGGSTGQILKYSASGTATWQAESTTPVLNNLTSTSTTSALSANQGKALKDGLDAVTLQSNDIETHISKTVSDGVHGLEPFYTGLLGLANDLSIPDTTVTPITFTNTAYSGSDLTSINHRSRLIIPESLNGKKCIFKFNVGFESNGIGYRYAGIYKNGTPSRPLPITTLAATKDTPTRFSGVSALMDVVTGDYFELMVQQTSGGALKVTSAFNTWLVLEVVE